MFESTESYFCFYCCDKHHDKQHLGEERVILTYSLQSILKDEAALRSQGAQGPGKKELGVAMGNITMGHRFHLLPLLQQTCLSQ